MQTQGSLQEADLATLLQTMQSERATGTLSLDSNGSSANLYFLFGHLFHATGPNGQGEPVVLDALHWHDGSFLFDPRAKLPAEETIKASPTDLIAQAGPPTVTPVEIPPPPVEQTEQAEHQDHAAEQAWGDLSGAPAVPVENPYAAGGVDTAGTPEQPYDPMQHWTPVEQPPEQPAAAWETPAEAAPAWDATPAAPSWSTPSEVTGDSWEAANSWGAPTAEPAPASVVPDVYTPPAANPEAAPVATAPAPVPELEVPMYPLSAGKPLYQGLKSGFVDFAKLLRTLRTDQHTGYVRLSESGGYSGVLLFHEGHLYEAISTEAKTQPILGEAAFMQFRTHIESGIGSIDVVTLSQDMVSSLARAFSGVPFPVGLFGRFIDFTALLDYLGDEKFTGSVVVAGKSETGVILMQEGRLVSSYTGSSKTLSDKPDAVALLAKEPGARIEIKTTAGNTQTIDVEAALARPY